MSVRTTADLVIEVLGDDYGPRRDGSLPSLRPYILAASIMVDRIVANAPGIKGVSIDAATAKVVETWLAAHKHKLSDKAFSSTSAGGASASFQGQTGQGLDATLYGQEAQRLDPSGLLRNYDKQQQASGAWLGKRVSDQIPYDQRD